MASDSGHLYGHRMIFKEVAFILPDMKSVLVHSISVNMSCARVLIPGYIVIDQTNSLELLESEISETVLLLLALSCSREIRGRDYSTAAVSGLAYPYAYSLPVTALKASASIRLL
jgi:hypothetical protein